MSLQNIKLPDIVIADLYRTSLIQEDVVAEVPKAIETGFKTLGNNKKQAAVIVHCPTEVFLPEGDLQFLTKMLGACKLNLADVAIVNHATMPVDIEKLKIQLVPRYALLFGVEPSAIQLPISFPQFKEQAFAGTTYLAAPSLDLLNKETEEAKVSKKKLWDCLKKMFV